MPKMIKRVLPGAFINGWMSSKRAIYHKNMTSHLRISDWIRLLRQIWRRDLKSKWQKYGILGLNFHSVLIFKVRKFWDWLVLYMWDCRWGLGYHNLLSIWHLQELYSLSFHRINFFRLIPLFTRTNFPLNVKQIILCKPKQEFSIKKPSNIILYSMFPTQNWVFQSLKKARVHKLLGYFLKFRLQTSSNQETISFKLFSAPLLPTGFRHLHLKFFHVSMAFSASNRTSTLLSTFYIFFLFFFFLKTAIIRYCFVHQVSICNGSSNMKLQLHVL